MSKLLLVEHPQEVGLVLVGVGGAQQRTPPVALLDPRVVAGRHLLGAVRRQAPPQQLVELDVLVAGLARVRRGAVQVAVGEGVDHPRPELTLQVEHEERDAGDLRHPPRVVGRVR